ncbi:MAG: C10 family peptidase [Prevotella sp.]|nr:C10 family peptidase [Prevotella sp.]
MKLTRQRIVFIAILTFLTGVKVEAAPRTKAQMQAAAIQAINAHRSTKRLAPKQAAELKTLKATANYEILGFENGGFTVISTDDLVPAVLGVSTSTYSSDEHNTNFQWWLKAMNDVIANAVEQQVQLVPIAPDADKYPTAIEPMLTTLWDQQDPYNRLCPNYNSYTKCLTGCVATAMAQVLNYHQTPEHGIGQRTIYYPHGNSYSGQPVTANFEEDYYDWAHMRDNYSSGNFSEEEANAVAMLMRDCGVAADMEYGGPNDGSGAYSEDAAKGLRDYFGFTDAQFESRDDYDAATWMDMVFRELSENGPLYYGGADYSQGGHAFVLHGYRADGKVYVNWGWSGDSDGYYDISLLNPSGYSFSYGQDMITGVKSNTHSLLRTETVNLSEEGTLQQTIEALEGEGQIGTLTITGPLNATDLEYVRYLAGFDAQGEPTEGQLRTIDMTHATLEGNQLPDGLFKDCGRLQRVRFPESLERIGREAFSGCTSLVELRVPTRSVPALGGAGVFSDVPVNSTKVYVRSGLKTKYQQAAQWKDFNRNNIIEFGSTVKVRNTIRYYGDENPSFTYKVEGDAITGTPILTCEATPESPAGRYPITISRGSITDETVDLVDGYLIVQKVKATAIVQDATREEGQPNPEFSLTFEGLKNGEETPVWLEAPVFTTTAGIDSPAGDYPILVESATAESYELTFVAGTLTVTPATDGIENILERQPASGYETGIVYDLQGRKVAENGKLSIANGQLEKADIALPKGIYILNGKKFIVK